MKWIWILIATLVASVAMAQGWKSISSKEAGLQFSVPTQPQSSTRSDKDGQFTVQTRMWTARGQNANYVVSVSFLPSGTPANFTANMIKGIKQGFMNTTGGTIVNEKSASFNGVSGQQVTFTTKSNVKGAIWIVTRNRKVYTFTIAKTSGAYDAEKNKFFGSVKIN